MSPLLMLIVAVIYAWVGIDLWRHGRHGMALTFIMYALANVGFMWDIWEGKRET